MTPADNTRRMVPVNRVVDDLQRQAQRLTLAGAYDQAAGMKDAVLRILRIADSGEASIEPSDEPEFPQ